jgi:hypothetical protein
MSMNYKFVDILKNMTYNLNDYIFFKTFYYHFKKVGNLRK